MDLKCLVKLLIEKKYIEECYKHDINGKTIVIVFECKIGFQEIYEKVISSHYDNKSIVIDENRFGRNRFYILNISNFEEGLIHIGDERERFGFRADLNGLGGVKIQTLIDIIKQNTRFSIIRQNFYGQVYFELRDDYIKEKRVNDEKNKENEIIDFLSQLP